MERKSPRADDDKEPKRQSIGKGRSGVKVYPFNSPSQTPLPRSPAALPTGALTAKFQINPRSAGQSERGQPAGGARTSARTGRAGVKGRACAPHPEPAPLRPRRASASGSQTELAGSGAGGSGSLQADEVVLSKISHSHEYALTIQPFVLKQEHYLIYTIE